MKFYTSVVQRGNELLVRGVENGRRFNKSVRYKPHLFVPAPAGQETPFRTLEGKPVAKVTFDSIREARDFVESYKDVANYTVYGHDRFIYPYILETYGKEIEFDPEQIVVANIDIEADSSDGFPDVETANREITAITMQRSGRTFAFGCGDFDVKDTGVEYFKCEDEKDLLLKFLDIWCQEYPDVMTGWYIDFFDVPYIINRITRLFGEDMAKRLSPWGKLEEKKIQIRGEDRVVYSPLGISVLDYQRLYKSKKFVMKPRESYSLDFIAHVELDEKKLDYSEYGSLHILFKMNFQKFMEYNVRDVVLVQKLDDKLKLLELVYTLAYDAGINYCDALGAVLQWEIHAYRYLMEQNIVFPPQKKSKKKELIGAYVKDPVMGGYEWVTSLDLNSLYSHLIMQFNISPETFMGKIDDDRLVIHDDEHADVKVEKFDRWLNDVLLKGGLDRYYKDARESNVTIAANLCCYTKKKRGFLPEMLERMYDKRVEYKAKSIEAKKRKEQTKDKELQKQIEKEIARYYNAQMALKVNLNSAYGCLTNEWFRFYSHENAEAITTSGRLAIRWIETKINQYMNKIMGTTDIDYVIASDTDSIYIHMGPLVKKVYEGKTPDKMEVLKFLDQVVQQKIEPFVEKSYGELAEYTNAFGQKMKMKRESICDFGIWRKKKHYILNILDKEGVTFAEPEIEMKGIASVRSSTPTACRNKIKEAIKIIMKNKPDELIDFIDKFRKEFNTLPFDEIAAPRSVSGLDDYSSSSTIYKKGSPIQVRGALLYNHWIKQKELKFLEPIYNDDKIKFVYLKKPNPIRENVIAVKDFLPPQLGLDQYIDYNTQFEKHFEKPMMTILKCIGWKIERQNTLDAFY